jgi:hypothetical protein
MANRISARALERAYAQDRHRPDMNGRVEKPNRADKAQANQMPEDAHAAGYHNDVPVTRWVRSRDATSKPHFDHVGNPGSAKGGARLKATGQDISDSPFSAAYIKPSNRRA